MDVGGWTSCSTVVIIVLLGAIFCFLAPLPAIIRNQKSTSKSLRSFAVSSLRRGVPAPTEHRLSLSSTSPAHLPKQAQMSDSCVFCAIISGPPSCWVFLEFALLCVLTGTGARRPTPSVEAPRDDQGVRYLSIIP